MRVVQTAMSAARSLISKLARPRPAPIQAHGVEQQRPERRRSRVQRAVKQAHQRVMGRLKQPPRHGEN